MRNSVSVKYIPDGYHLGIPMAMMVSHDGDLKCDMCGKEVFTLARYQHAKEPDILVCTDHPLRLSFKVQETNVG